MKRRVWMISLLALFLTACGNSGNSEDSIQGNFMEDSAQEIPVEDNLQATTFTMEELMTLWSDDNYIEAIEEEGIGFFLQYENFELVQDEDASTWIYEALLPYGDRTYQLRVEHNWPHQFEQSFPNDNPVERIVLREMEFGDEITLYSRSDKEYEKLNITGFLAKEYHDITYYLDFDLPEGVALGEHKLYMDLYYSGSYFQCDKSVHEDQADDYFCRIGGIGVTEEEQQNKVLTFENGKLVDAAHISNHGGRYSEWEQIENEDLCAIIANYNYDRFTGTDMIEYEENYGISLADAEKTCEYWCVFMGDEGEERSYYAFFHKGAFTKEEIIGFVKSIRVK